MRKDQWNTYRTTCATFDAAGDQASAGGVHLHQVRRARGGFWQTRICQSNGGLRAYSAVTPVSAEVGESLFATAEQG